MLYLLALPLRYRACLPVFHTTKTTRGDETIVDIGWQSEVIRLEETIQRLFQ